MASRQPERCIPHVRDIFQLPLDGVRSDVDGTRCDTRLQSPHLVDDPGDDEHSCDCHRRGKASSRSQPGYDHSQYGRTLTEKDLKHIERHLSMKKTIRKQLSRHLTQAFVDTESNAKPANQQNGSKEQLADVLPLGDRRRSAEKPSLNDGLQNTYNLTFTRSNVAKSEASFLDLLKEIREDGVGGGGDDSGHCSPTCDLDVLQSDWQKNFGRRHHPKQLNNNNHHQIKNGVVGPGTTEVQDAKKSSFWKKLTIRAKSKR